MLHAMTWLLYKHIRCHACHSRQISDDLDQQVKSLQQELASVQSAQQQVLLMKEKHRLTEWMQQQMQEQEQALQVGHASDITAHPIAVACNLHKQHGLSL